MKKRILSLFLSIVMLIGIVPTGLFTITAGAKDVFEDNCFEYHVNTYSDLQNALEDSQGFGSLKKIYIEKSIETNVNSSCTTVYSYLKLRVFRVVEDCTIIFKPGTSLVLNCKGPKYEVSGYEDFVIFDMVQDAQLTILGNDNETAITVNAISPTVVFNAIHGDNLVYIKGGSYYFNYSNTEYSLEEGDYSFIKTNYVAHVRSAYVNMVANPIEDCYVFNTSPAYDSDVKIFAVDSNIKMYCKHISSDIQYFENGEIPEEYLGKKHWIFSNFDVKTMMTGTEIETDGTACMAQSGFAEYFDFDSFSVYQYGSPDLANDFVDKNTFKVDTAGLCKTKFTFKNEALSTDVYLKDTATRYDRIQYFPNMNESLKVYEIGDRIYDELRKKAEAGTLSSDFYDYNERSYFLIYDVTDGEEKPVKYNAGANVVKNYYITLNKDLDLDVLNNDIEGGISGKILVIKDAYAMERCFGDEDFDILRSCDSLSVNPIYIYGGKYMSEIEFYKNMNVEYNTTIDEDVSPEIDRTQIKIVSVLQKAGYDGENIVWTDLKAGDTVEKGTYRFKFYVIPKIGFMIDKNTKLYYQNEWVLQNDGIVDYPNDYENCQDIALVCHSYEFTTTGKIIKNISLNNAGFHAGDILNMDGGPINLNNTDGVKEAYFLYELNGKALKDGTTVTYGDYDCCVELIAEDDYIFRKGITKVTVYGKEISEYNVVTVSADGKTAWVDLSTVHVNCKHESSSWLHSDLKHWKVCTVCGAKYSETDHNYETETVGNTVTYTCADCGFTKTGRVAETRTEAKDIYIIPGTAVAGSEKPLEILLGYMTDPDGNKYYDFATIENVVWSNSGSTFANEKQTLTLTLKANENYYFTKTSFPCISIENFMQYTRESYTLINDTTLKATFSFTPYTITDYVLVLPELSVGKTYYEIAEETVFLANGEAIDDYSIGIKGTDGEYVSINVNNGVPSGAEAWLTRTVEADSVYTFDALIYLKTEYGNNIDIANPNIGIVTDVDVDNIYRYVRVYAVYETSYNGIYFISVNEITEPECGKEITAGNVITGEHYINNGAWYEDAEGNAAEGAFACGESYKLIVTLLATDNYHFVDESELKSVTINGHDAAVTFSDGSYIEIECILTAPDHSFVSWESDADSHWHICGNEGCNETSDKAAHSFAGGVCEICGYSKDGKTVSGTVTSSGDENQDVTIGLYKTGEKNPEYSTTVSGNNASYSISDVKSGTYTMRVMKNKRTIGEYRVLVGAKNVTQNVEETEAEESEPSLAGDINGDGRIKGNDATLLLKHLADWNVTITEANADCNGDGKIKGNDATLLLKYLADWDVKLGK